MILVAVGAQVAGSPPSARGVAADEPDAFDSCRTGGGERECEVVVGDGVAEGEQPDEDGQRIGDAAVQDSAGGGEVIAHRCARGDGAECLGHALDRVLGSLQIGSQRLHEVGRQYRHGR